MFYLGYHSHIRKQLYTNCELINDIQFYDGDLDDWIPGTKYAFFINSTIFEKCEKLLEARFEHDKVDIWDYKFQIGNRLYDMKLVFLTMDDEEIYNYMQDLVFSTQFSFRWEDQATLYKSVNLYHKLEEFIRVYNLKSAIEKIEEIESISDDGANIKVITFTSYVDQFDVIQKYREFISVDYSDEPTYYYFTTAFPWYQQPLLGHFEIPIENDKIDSVFPIVIRHLYYSNATNIFDLIAIKLAICDFRDPSHSNQLKDEIDSLIQLSLCEMVTSKSYIKNRVFDLIQYSMDHNVKPIPSCILYLVYTFQNYFDSVRIEFADELTIRPAILNLSMIDPIIKLTEQFDELSRIRERSNIRFRIDGSGFNRMTMSLFLDLIEHVNVSEIILDTNFAWMTNDTAVISKKYKIKPRKGIIVKLIGTNGLNFVEELVGFLKIFKHSNMLNLFVFCPLRSYMIFDNLEVSDLRFYEIHVDHKLLDELARCNLKLKSIYFEHCTLENKTENWELIDSMKPLRSITIKEDEDTWQYIFGYISNRLMNSNLKSFKFKAFVVIVYGTRSTSLHMVQFTLDEYNSKLLLQNFSTQLFLDLYELKYSELAEEKDDVDYDFYQ